jgi:hypothetical protein
MTKRREAIQALDPPCGCTFQGNRWVDWCAQHKAEHDELHQRAAEDYRRQQNEDLR